MRALVRILAICIALWVATHSPLLLVILLLGLIEAWRAFRRSDPAYLAVAPRRLLPPVLTENEIPPLIVFLACPLSGADRMRRVASAGRR